MVKKGGGGLVSATHQEEEFESMAAVCTGQMNVLNAISKGGEPLPCDLHIQFEQQDYYRQKLLQSLLNHTAESDISFMYWKIGSYSMCAFRFEFMYVPF